MFDDTKRRELLSLAETEGILAVRAWKRRSSTVSVVVDAEANANEKPVFNAIMNVIGEVPFDWIRSDQKKSYVQDEYSYKGEGFEISVVFISQIKKAI